MIPEYQDIIQAYADGYRDGVIRTRINWIVAILIVIALTIFALANGTITIN